MKFTSIEEIELAIQKSRRDILKDEKFPINYYDLKTQRFDVKNENIIICRSFSIPTFNFYGEDLTSINKTIILDIFNGNVYKYEKVDKKNPKFINIFYYIALYSRAMYYYLEYSTSDDGYLDLRDDYNKYIKLSIGFLNDKAMYEHYFSDYDDMFCQEDEDLPRYKKHNFFLNRAVELNNIHAINLFTDLTMYIFTNDAYGPYIPSYFKDNIKYELYKLCYENIYKVCEKNYKLSADLGSQYGLAKLCYLYMSHREYKKNISIKNIYELCIKLKVKAYSNRYVDFKGNDIYKDNLFSDKPSEQEEHYEFSTDEEDSDEEDSDE